MNEGLKDAWVEAKKPRTVPFFERLSAHVNALPPGDRLIAYALGLLIVLASIVGFLALENKLLVRVPAYGGTLNEGVLGSPRFVNPLLALTDADRDLAALTYAGLMGVAGDGSLVPVLAESYEISPDGKQYTFTLHADAKFSDGTPVTAEDVVFTVLKAQDPALKSPSYGNWAGVASEVVDARTVRFTLAKPYAPFLANTTLGILPAHLWKDIPDEQFPFSTLVVEPVGAGPFVVADVSRDSAGLITTYNLKANENYVPGRPYLDGITFRFFSRQDDLAAALKNGSVESAYGLPAGKLGSKILTAPYSRVFGVFFNPSEHPVFARLEVRKALSLAINREAIAQEVLGGYATPIMGPVPPGSGIEETPVPLYADPTAEASGVLERAGWAYDGSARVWKHAGAKLTLEPITVKTSNVPELKAVATSIKSDWEKLGVATNIELYEPGDLNQNVIRPRKYDALFFGMVIGRDLDLYAFWDSQERNDPGLNIALYANKTVDTLLSDARQTSDAAKRLADLQKVEDTIAGEYPAAFTHAPDFVYVVPQALSGVSLPRIATPDDRFSSVASWYLSTDAVWPFLVQEK